MFYTDGGWVNVNNGLPLLSLPGYNLSILFSEMTKTLKAQCVNF